MAEAYTMFWLMVLSTVIGHCVATTLSSEQHVDENTILDLAEKSNKTFLKLIGLAIQNLRCDFDRCSQWSEWTGGVLTRGQFGVKTRSRDCWYDSCNNTGPKVVENDNAIYKGNCPASYNVSDGKLCFAYYKDKVNHSAAQHLCQKDGGSLITVDTKERYELAQKYTTSNHVHVQGARGSKEDLSLMTRAICFRTIRSLNGRQDNQMTGQTYLLPLISREQYTTTIQGKASSTCYVK